MNLCNTVFIYRRMRRIELSLSTVENDTTEENRLSLVQTLGATASLSTRRPDCCVRSFTRLEQNHRHHHHHHHHHHHRSIQATTAFRTCWRDKPSERYVTSQKPAGQPPCRTLPVRKPGGASEQCLPLQQLTRNPLIVAARIATASISVHNGGPPTLPVLHAASFLCSLSIGNNATLHTVLTHV